MTRIFLATAALLTAFATTQAGASEIRNERPECGTVLFQPQFGATTAGQIMSSSERAELGVSASRSVPISIFPSSGMIDAPSRGE